MTKLVLEEWGVRCLPGLRRDRLQHDRGQGWLAKTDKDSRADFSNGYDFDEAFRQPFLPKGKQTVPVPKVKPVQSPKAKP
jgi:uncharacterized repeat protein (TIGR04138 family)